MPPTMIMNKNNKDKDDKDDNDENEKKKTTHHHQKNRSGRIFSPLEDLPWLVDELETHKQKSCSLVGNQLRIIVQAVYPIREVIVDSTVQF